jgi:hypothetical protein
MTFPWHLNIVHDRLMKMKYVFYKVAKSTCSPTDEFLKSEHVFCSVWGSLHANNVFLEFHFDPYYPSRFCHCESYSNCRRERALRSPAFFRMINFSSETGQWASFIVLDLPRTALY